MKFSPLKLFSFALCLLAVLCVLFTAGDVSAQCGVNGSVGCGAPAVTSLNAQLANSLAVQSVPTLAPAQASSAASSSTSAGAIGVPAAITLPQNLQVATVHAQPQVQYVQAQPQVQYVYVQPQPQAIQVAAATLPQVQFSTAPVAVTAPVGASAVASASTASTALPIIAAQPAAIVSGCASGSCGRGGRLQALRRPTSRSRSVSVSRSG